MSVYKLSGSGVGGTENGIAQLDIQFDGIITAISGTIRAALDAANELMQGEVSFISTNTLGSNDTRGSLYAMQLQMGITTSGALLESDNSSVGGLAIAVNSGERLWLHIVCSASTASQAEFYIYVEDGQVTPTPQRRR